MSQDDIERRVRRDTVWERPTWPLGGRPSHAPPLPDDPLELFGRRPRAQPTDAVRPWPPGSPEARALDVLAFQGPVTLAAVKAHYKELAKKLHPDRNGGSTSFEDRLKQINEAYATLRKSLTS
ncbi:MAG: J domain-containing protein [Alphaproteobacteria bacterium]